MKPAPTPTVECMATRVPSPTTIRRPSNRPTWATAASLTRFATLLAVTAAAAIVMAIVGGGWWGEPPKNDKALPKQTGKVFSRASVTVRPVTPGWREVTDSYTGMIRPLERYSLAFEVPGRVVALGRNAKGQPLDDGDEVRGGQVLAKLDADAYNFRVQEAEANLEQARVELQRAIRVNKVQRNVITATELQNRQTQVKLAVSRLELVKENLTDTTLVFPGGSADSRESSTDQGPPQKPAPGEVFEQ